MRTFGSLGVRGKVAITFGTLVIMVQAVGMLNAVHVRAVSHATIEFQKTWLPAIEAPSRLMRPVTQLACGSARPRKPA